jgi:hypothetical protein
VRVRQSCFDVSRVIRVAHANAAVAQTWILGVEPRVAYYRDEKRSNALDCVTAVLTMLPV